MRTAEKDIVKCKYVDYTKLGLVEITRQKIRRSLIEYFTKTVDKSGLRLYINLVCRTTRL